MPQMNRILGLLVVSACAAPPFVPDEAGPFDRAAPAALREVSAGVCPALRTGEVALTSAGHARTAQLYVPPDPEGAGVLFLFHGNANASLPFAIATHAPIVALTYGWIVVVPQAATGSLGLDWGVPPADPVPDVTLFDDLLACLAQTYDVDRRRVMAAGFSAGGMWTSWLAMHRSTYLAAVASLSGGCDGDVFFSGDRVNPCTAPASAVPALLSYGGAGDVAFLDFAVMSERFADELAGADHPVVVCDHEQGHVLPPSLEQWAWPYLDAHSLDGSPSPFETDDPLGVLPEGCTWR